MQDCWRSESRFSMRGFGCASFYLWAVMGVLRKVWLVVLTLLTVAFLTTLAVLSETKPTQWLTDQEVDELVEQDMLEKGFINSVTGEYRYD